MTLDFQRAVKSPYNLAPIISAKNVKIKKTKTDDGLLTENNHGIALGNQRRLIHTFMGFDRSQIRRRN